jgi:hypothetical protein
VRAVPYLAAALVLTLLGSQARAQADKASSSLDLIPADAGFYSSMLRNKEQVEIVARSRAWAELWQMPAVQMGWKMLQDQYQGGQLAPLQAFLSQAENRELLDLLADAASHDIFIYGGSNWIQFIQLAGILQSASRFGPILGMIEKGGPAPDPQLQARMVLRAAAAHPELIVIPDFILGFKLTDKTKAEHQIQRLEAIALTLADQHPLTKGRVKSTKVGADSFLTFALDGSMIPWEHVPIKDIEEKEGEFDGVVKKLKELKLALSIGVRDDFLLVALGSAPEVAAQLGAKGKRLLDSPELKPLAAATSKPLTSIGYVSASLRGASGISEQDVDSFLQLARQALNKADIPDDKRKQIVKDLEGLAKEMVKNTPEVGPEVAFSYMTDRGAESFIYDYTKDESLDGSKPLTLLNHLGGRPIGAAVFRHKSSPEDYRNGIKWLKTLYGHVEDAALEKLDKEQRAQYEKISKEVFPLLRRLDEITGTMLLPSLADGQSGIVLDAKWSSKQWHSHLPATPKPMPLPEFALLLGVSDADLLVKALHSYRELINDALAKAKEMAPPGSNVPDIQVPAAEKSQGKGGQLYSYAPPAEWGLDSQVRLTAGISAKVFAVSLSQAMTERLLQAQPLRTAGGPLSDPNKPLAAAGIFNWPALVDAATPWIELALSAAPLPEEGAPPGLGREDVIKQVRTVLRVLKVWRGYSSAVYIEGGAVVTHGETVIRDLDAGKR